MVRKSGEFSGRAEIPFGLSDRPEKSPEFRTGPKVRPENSVGRNSGLPFNVYVKKFSCLARNSIQKHDKTLSFIFQKILNEMIYSNQKIKIFS